MGRGARRVRHTLLRLSSASGLKPLAAPIASLSASTVAGAVASFTGLVFLARVLGIRELGQITYAQATAGLIFAILDPRVEDGVITFMPLVRTRADGGASAKLFHRAMIFDQSLGGGAAVVIALLLASGLIGPPGPTTTTYLTLAVLQGGVLAALGTASAGFAVTDGLARLGVIRVVSDVMTTFASVGALYLAGGVGYMTAQVSASSALALVVSMLALRRVKGSFGHARTIPRGAARGFIGFTIRSSLATTVGAGTSNLPLMIVGSVGGSTLLGMFRVSLSASHLVTTAFSPVAAASYPLLSRHAAEGRIGQIRAHVLAWSGMLAAVALLGAGGSWIALPILVPAVFGGKYSSVVAASWILVCAALIRGTVIWGKVLPLAISKSGLKLAVMTCDAVVVVAAIWWATPGGLVAIALGQLAAAFIYATFWLAYSWLFLGSGEGNSSETKHRVPPQTTDCATQENRSWADGLGGRSE